MYIDLSVPINEQTPVYPGDPKTQIQATGSLENDGFQDHVVTLGTHVGTHMDAPAHMIPEGKTLDQYPVERFIGKGIIIKVDQKYNLDQIKKAPITRGGIVLFHTGFDKKYHSVEYFENYPVMPEDIAHYLVEKQVSIVGFDTCGPDNGPFPMHKILLAGDVLIIENLTGLERLGGEFEVIALPAKFQLDGAPCRVVAKSSTH